MMRLHRRFGFAVSILVCFLVQAQGADKYTDENRPYEFGFNVEIEGNKQQHRHEKKDKDGIIMGEFGFVTADDVYHVTVYATDKDGHFKILSMKNIRLKSSKEKAAGPALSARQGHSLSLPDAPVAPITQPTAAPPSPESRPSVPAPPPSPAVSVSPPQTPFKPLRLEPPGRSCSSCSIPTTTRVPPPASLDIFAPQNQQSFPASSPAPPSNIPQSGFSNQPSRPQVEQPSYNQQPPAVPSGVQGSYPVSPSSAPASYSPKSNGEISNGPIPSGPVTNGPIANGPVSSGSISNTPNTQPDISARFGQTPEQPAITPIAGEQPSGPSAPQSGSGGRTSKQYNGPEQNFSPDLSSAGPPQGGQLGPVKPTLQTARMQIVDGDTDIHTLRPGEQKGLPPGLTTDDISQLLYTFNYTVGFHGHFEEGYTNGVKKGYYFVTGRNGVRTRIDYVADDTGFHPKISQEVLDLLSEDVPKPETEKDAKYGLKGYEFKWLYYPEDQKKP